MDSTRFSRYSDTSFQSITLALLIEDEGCVARVEDSGSENVYVEVAKWHDSAGWCRYAFLKCEVLEEAVEMASKININSLDSKIFHTFKNYPEQIQASA
tara:strand:- start:7726 stop:8022 length:297 start_codon:yes stop_codon:yes gene_type:complete